MSVQLIVYPQNYDGLSNSNNPSNQFFVDGISFNNVNTSANTLIATPLPQGAIDYYNPIMSVNTWYRYYDVGSAYVSETSSFLRLISNATNTQNGIIQKLSNLTIGAVYNIEMNVGIMVGAANLLVFNGTVLQSTHAIASGIQTLQFTANSTSDTLLIDSKYISISNLIQINTIAVTAAAISPSGAIQVLEDGQVICDLYEDEDLPLTLSVDDFKNVAEKVQSYSKAFNLPATKRNNKIFDHIFEITREVASAGGLLFNPYKRTKCVLKQDGFILFEGYLRLLDVTDKEGEISYNVNLYSEVIALADTLKDKAFRDLDFTELVHLYNRTQITNSWNDVGTGIAYTNPSTSGFRDAYSTVKYPFCDWTHQIQVGGSNNSNATSGNPELLTLEAAFRPFISIKYLIDRIFAATPFTYESDFFNEADFNKLYMDFNWGADNNPFSIDESGEGYVDTVQTATTSFAIIQTNDNTFDTNLGYSAGVYTALADNQLYAMNYYPFYTVSNNVAWSATFQWILTRASGFIEPPINTQTVTGTGLLPGGLFSGGVWSGNFSELLNLGDTLHLEFKSDTASTNAFTIEPIGNTGQNPFGIVGAFYVSTSATAMTTNSFLQTLRGELGQWDFLKGLITMFNLVTLVDEDNPNNIIIEPYSDVFIPTATAGNTLANRGIEHDWTDKIDVSEMKLNPLTDLNRKTIFKFVEDDDDYSFNQYKNQVGGHLYGSKKYNAGNEFNILDGEDEIVAEPFAATVVKQLMSQLSQFVTPAIYSYNVESDTSEGFDNSPRIMYNNGIKSTGVSYYIPAQNGVTDDNESDFLQFSHFSIVPSNLAALDFHFGECQLMTGVGNATPNNLFNLYWLPYYSELYNPNTRTMTIKVNLSPADINTFKFNHKVFIKNRVFRVNKIDYKPNDLATVEFILIP